ncbi:MAG: DUF2147 domain-containing protein [Enhydrobacter sp.]
MTRSLVALFVGLYAFPASAQTPSVMGTWLTASKAAEIRLMPCVDPARGPVCGQIVKLIDPKDSDGKPMVPEDVTDRRNTDPSLRSRKVLGMIMLYDFAKTGDPNSFESGTIYSGENGKTYKANLGLQTDGTLRLRGYVGTPMFGETQIWTRVE